MKWTVGRKIGLAYGVFTLLLLSVSVVSYLQTKEVEAKLRVLKEEELESGLLSRLSYHLVRLERATHGESSAGLPSDKSPGEELTKAQSVLRSLQQFTAETTETEHEHEAREALWLESMKNALERIALDLGKNGSFARKSVEKRRKASASVTEECKGLTETISLFRSEDAPVAHEAWEHSKGVTRHSTQIVFYTALSCMVTALATGFYFVRVISRPIKKLHEGANRIGRGDFEHKIEVGTSDEIGDLANEFNRMSKHLKSSYQDLEQQVSDKTRQLLHSTRLAGIGTLAAGIAHEINNPLASVASCAEGLLQRAEAPALQQIEEFQDFHEYLDIIREEAYRCKSITRSLLDFSRKQEPVVENVNLVERLNAAVALLQRKADDEGKHISIKAPAQKVTIKADPGQLSQLFFNLISNGLEAVERGGHVTIGVEPGDTETLMFVQDDGAGIPPEELERIWEPFFTTKPPGEGTGLGLTLCYSIVQNHNGRIECRSDGLFQGSIFEVVFPKKVSTEATL